MILRTIFFFVLLYFLVKVLSRMFLPSGRQNQRSRSGFDFFYTGSSNDPGNRQSSGRSRKSGNVKQRLDQIEEAEFEEITDEETDSKSSSKRSD